MGGKKSKLDKSKDRARRPSITKRPLQQSKKYTILLTGTGEGGKTTVLRQLKLILGENMQVEEEAKKSKTHICFNVIEGTAMTLLYGASILRDSKSLYDTEYKDIIMNAYNEAVERQGTNEKTTLNDEELVEALRYYMKDRDFKKILTRSNLYQIHDGWEYFSDKFLTQYPSWGGRNWKPSTDDLLRARIRTTGINFANFDVEGIKFTVVDLGGQRMERRKFGYANKKADALLFVVNMNEYDEVLFEDESVNRLEESLEYWNKMANHRFKDAFKVLLFNKYDLFVEKYKTKKVRIPKTLPDISYPEPPPLAEDDDEDCTKVKRWYEKLFRSQLEGENKHAMRTYVTSALDKDSLKDVWEKMSNFLLPTFIG